MRFNQLKVSNHNEASSSNSAAEDAPTCQVGDSVGSLVRSCFGCLAVALTRDDSSAFASSSQNSASLFIQSNLCRTACELGAPVTRTHT